MLPDSDLRLKAGRRQLFFFTSSIAVLCSCTLFFGIKNIKAQQLAFVHRLHTSPPSLRTHCCARLSAFLNPSWRAYVKNLLNNSRLLAVRRNNLNNLKALVRLRARLARLTFSSLFIRCSSVSSLKVMNAKC